jgi:ParB-like chromosome segregation protein Spo0J
MSDEKAKAPKIKVDKVFNKLEELKIEIVPCESVKPNEYNPNRQDPETFDLLCKSITEDGFTQPIVVQAETRIIVDGEHRWRAAQALGMATIPVVFVNMTEAQRRIATLRHNRARGNELVDLTASVMRDLEKLGCIDIAKDSLGLDDIEIERMLKDIPVTEELGTAPEFSESWLPDKMKGGGMETHSTEEARRVEFMREDKLSKAKSEEEKEMIRKENNIFRVAFVYTGEEAKIVKEALGRESAASVLLGLCKQKLGL